MWPKNHIFHLYCFLHDIVGYICSIKNKQMKKYYFATVKNIVWGCGQTQKEALEDGLKWLKGFYETNKTFPISLIQTNKESYDLVSNDSWCSSNELVYNRSKTFAYIKEFAPNQLVTLKLSKSELGMIRDLLQSDKCIHSHDLYLKINSKLI